MLDDQIKTRIKKAQDDIQSGMVKRNDDIYLQGAISYLELIDKYLSENTEKQQSVHSYHPLGASPSEKAWLLYLLDRCEALIEMSASGSRQRIDQETTNVDVYPSLTVALVQSIFNGLIILRSRILNYRTEVIPSRFREILYLKYVSSSFYDYSHQFVIPIVRAIYRRIR